jgi:hypothetical protein
MGEWRNMSINLDLGAIIETSGQLHAMAALLRGKSPQVYTG